MDLFEILLLVGILSVYTIMPIILSIMQDNDDSGYE